MSDHNWVETRLICCECYAPRTYIMRDDDRYPWVCEECEADRRKRRT